MCQQMQPAATSQHSQHSSHRLTAVTHVVHFFFFFFFFLFFYILSRNAESWRLSSATTDRVTEFLAIMQLNNCRRRSCRHFFFVCLLKDFKSFLFCLFFFNSMWFSFNNFPSISNTKYTKVVNNKPAPAAASFDTLKEKESINQTQIA